MTQQATAENIADVILKIKSAFDTFESQSGVLQSSYDTLKQNLAESNRQLSSKNQALSEKVQELQQMSTRLQCILGSMTDSVLVVDDNLKVERCNSAAGSLLGLPQSMIEGRNYSEISNGLGNGDLVRMAITEGKSVLDQERRSTRHDGEEIIVLASIAPIRSPQGPILGAIEVLRDVTDLRRLEEKVACQKRMAALGEMAASVAHEIRNPLGTIEGFASLLKRDLETMPEHSRLATKIVEGVQNLNYVITSLLTYARPMSLSCEEFDAGRFISDLRDVLAPNAAGRGVAFAIETPSQSFMLRGDKRQLRQVLINLGLNAIEACAAGGHVHISASRGRTTAIFEVADDGCGISKADRQRLFDPFFTRKQGGTGLGLSLCHKIVLSHGGEIEVASEPNNKTVFKVLLPGAVVAL